jgi:hypothetical protein
MEWLLLRGGLCPQADEVKHASVWVFRRGPTASAVKDEVEGGPLDGSAAGGVRHLAGGVGRMCRDPGIDGDVPVVLPPEPYQQSEHEVLQSLVLLDSVCSNVLHRLLTLLQETGMSGGPNMERAAVGEAARREMDHRDRAPRNGPGGRIDEGCWLDPMRATLSSAGFWRVEGSTRRAPTARTGVRGSSRRRRRSYRVSGRRRTPCRCVYTAAPAGSCRGRSARSSR